MIIVLFSTVARQDVDVEDYQRTSARMRELVSIIPGFISYNAYAGETGEGMASPASTRRRPWKPGGPTPSTSECRRRAGLPITKTIGSRCARRFVSIGSTATAAISPTFGRCSRRVPRSPAQRLCGNRRRR